MTRLLVAWVVLALPAASLAGSSGLGIPETGGQNAGAASLGAEGLTANPATSATVDGGEIFFDIGALYLSPTYTPATTQQEVSYVVVSPHPSLSMAFRPEWSRLGVGFSAFVPYGRNTKYPIEGAQRYHIADLTIHSIHFAPSVSYEPTPVVRVGAGPTFSYNTIELTQRVDMGVTLYQLDPSATPLPPIEDPFLEGQLNVDHAEGFSIGWQAGVLIQPSDHLTLGIGYLSGPPVEMRGRSVLTPSLDLALESHADFTMNLPLPPTVNVGGRWDATNNVRLGFDFQWINWNVVERVRIEFENSELRGTNPELDALMLVLGSELDLASALDKEKYVGRYFENTWNGRVMGAVRVRKQWMLRTTLGYDRHAIPDHVVNAGNLDFDSFVLGFGVERELSGRWTFFASSTQLIPVARNITNSEFDPYASEESGLANTNANGHYSALLNRTAVGFRYSWGK